MMIFMKKSLFYPDDNNTAWNFATKGAGGKNHEDDNIYFEVEEGDDEMMKSLVYSIERWSNPN